MFPKLFHVAAGLLLWLERSALINAADLSNFTLWAYGTNISGLPVFYGDSYAYVGYGTPHGVSVASNITFSMNDSSLYAVKNSSVGGSSNFTGPVMFYINTETGATAQSGFLTSNDTTMSTSGFRFYGTDLEWETSDGVLMSNFWANTTDDEGIWNLIWNEPGVLLDDATPVVIKTEAPGT